MALPMVDVAVMWTSDHYHGYYLMSLMELEVKLAHHLTPQYRKPEDHGEGDVDLNCGVE